LLLAPITDANNSKALGALDSRGSLRASLRSVLTSPCFADHASPFQSTRFRITRAMKRARDRLPPLPGFAASAANHPSFSNRAAVGRERVAERKRGSRDQGKGRAAVLTWRTERARRARAVSAVAQRALPERT